MLESFGIVADDGARALDVVNISAAAGNERAFDVLGLAIPFRWFGFDSSTKAMNPGPL